MKFCFGPSMTNRSLLLVAALAGLAGPLAHAARVVLGWARSAKVVVTAGRRWFWGW